MLLAIDCGNTNVVFAVCEGETIRGTWRAATDVRRTADEYAVWLTQLMALSGLDRSAIDGVIIASVVPEALFNLKTLARRYFNCEALVVGDDGVDTGVKAKVDRPEEVGADRIVNVAAARGLYGTPLIIIDFGTATTFDIVDSDGDYAGGVIAPGINLSLEALRLATAKLPGVAIRRPASVIGKSTVPAMQSGIFWGYVGLIEGLVSRIRAEMGVAAGVVATGGLAPLFQEATPVIDRVDADLTLRGLAIIHARNRGSR